MDKLLGGYDTKHNHCRIYDSDGELKSIDMKTPQEVIESLIIYMSVPWLEYLTFKFFKPNKEEENYYCEAVVENFSYEAFICGYGDTQLEAFRDYVFRLFDWQEKYTKKEG